LTQFLKYKGNSFLCNLFPYCITGFGLWTYLQRHDETSTHLWWKEDFGSW